MNRNFSQMYNPPHPGELVKVAFGDMSVTDAAKRLGVTRAALSRIINGHAGISADMAIRLELALNKSAQMWLDMQSQYDLWVASQKPLPKIEPITFNPAHSAG